MMQYVVALAGIPQTMQRKAFLMSILPRIEFEKKIQLGAVLSASVTLMFAGTWILHSRDIAESLLENQQTIQRQLEDIRFKLPVTAQNVEANSGKIVALEKQQDFVREEIGKLNEKSDMLSRDIDDLKNGIRDLQSASQPHAPVHRPREQ